MKKKVIATSMICVMGAVLMGMTGSGTEIYAENPDTEYDLIHVNHAQDVQLYLGDLNEDHKITLEEAGKILNYALHIEEPQNNLEAFRADYDGNAYIELADVRPVLETSLGIRAKKKAYVFDRSPQGDIAYICDVKEGQLKPSVEWLDSEEKISEYIKPYESKWYQKELKDLTDWVKFQNESDDVVLYNATEDITQSGTENNMRMEKRGIIVGRVEVQESEDYVCMWIHNNHNHLLYVLGINPIEGAGTKVFSTYNAFGILLNEDEEDYVFNLSSYVEY